MTILDNTETVITFPHEGSTYEIDHLGICRDEQYGQYAIYHNGTMVGSFTTDSFSYHSDHRPSLPSKSQLIDFAKQELTNG
jgi:hypothetical protein